MWIEGNHDEDAAGGNEPAAAEEGVNDLEFDDSVYDGILLLCPPIRNAATRVHQQIWGKGSSPISHKGAWTK